MRHKKYLVYSIIAGVLLAIFGYALSKIIPIYDLYILIAVSIAFIFFTLLVLFRKVHDDLQEYTANAIAVTDGWNMFYQNSGIKIMLPALSSFTITADFAFLLAKTILDKKPATIIELGGGRSTLIAAAVMQKENLNGRIISIDADSRYQEQCRQYAVANGLENYITFIYAPLESVQIDLKNYLWYNLPNMEDKHFDLLIIDGPPEVKGTLSRYPALPQLIEHANKNAVVLADDANRPDMQKTLELWKQKFPYMQVESVPLMRGALLIQINGA